MRLPVQSPGAIRLGPGRKLYQTREKAGLRPRSSACSVGPCPDGSSAAKYCDGLDTCECYCDASYGAVCDQCR
jgi:hypothetical protein